MPIYNEKKTLLEILRKINKVKLDNIEKEVIIVDDFSTDGTREILKRIKGHKVLFHEKNKGKGSAIRTGLKHSTGDVILIQDADLEYDPADYPKLLKPIINKKAKVVYGSRFSGKHKAKYKTYYLGNILLSLITRIIYLRKITDMETCYKVFRKDVIKSIKLKAKRFDFEPEITAKLIKKGYKIVEVPIWYKCRDFKEGKKITWKDGLKAVFYLLKYRLLD